MAPQLKVKVVRKPVLKVKMLPTFPASVSATLPVSLDRTGGNYAFGLDITSLRLSLDPLYAPIGSSSPGGSSGQIQYNNGGVFAGLSSISAANGGTGFTSYTIGDIVYASGATALSKLSAVAAGQPLISGGVSTAPGYSGTWAKFDTANTRLIVNKNTSYLSPVNANTAIHVVGQDSPTEMSIELTVSGSDGVFMGSRYNGTMASRTPLATDDYVATFVSAGVKVNGGTMVQGNAISHRASENWTNTATGMYTAVYGNTDGTTTFGEWVRWRNARQGIGDTNPQYKLTVNRHATSGISDPFGNDGLGLIGADAGGITFSMQTFGTSPNPNITMFKARGTNASKTAVSSGDIIAQFQAFGYAGSTSLYNGGAGFQVVANQTMSTGNAGTRLELTATPDASTTQAVAATIYGSKSLFVGASPSDPGAGMVASQNGVKLPSFTVGTLPAGVTGQTVWCSNARVYNLGTGVLEGAGAGTGSLVTYNGTNWRTPSNNATVAA